MAASLLQRLEVRRVVVFRALQLGDMLCAVPALRALRAALPQARIALVGLPWAAQFAQRFNALVDDFFAFPGHADLPEQAVRQQDVADFYAGMRARSFSLALQMHGSGAVSNGIVGAFGARAYAGFAPDANAAGIACSGWHCLPYPDHGPEPLRLLRLVNWLGAPPQGCDLAFPLTARDHEELRGTGVGAGLRPGGYACIHPGARRRDKCWPAHCFAEVADWLAQEHGLGIVLTGAANETALVRAVADRMREPVVCAALPWSIGAMAALMSGARLLVCNDTGVAHIAAGLGLDSVIVFSKADMRRWAPLNRRRHRCVWDPAGEQAAQVRAAARGLLMPGPETGRGPAR